MFASVAPLIVTMGGPASPYVGPAVSAEDPTPWFEEDWDYVDFPELNDQEGYTTVGGPVGQLTLEKSLTGTPWGGALGVRVALDATVCEDQPEIGVRITEIPGIVAEQPREIWWKTYAKWSSNYDTNWGCSNGEHKFLQHYDESADRWHFLIGSGSGRKLRTFGDQFTEHQRKDWRIPVTSGSTDDNLDARTALWDSAWHEMKGHYRMGEGDGITEAWLDGVKALEHFDLTTVSVGNYFKSVYFSSNHNEGPTEVIDVIFGRYRLWITDPGW